MNWEQSTAGLLRWLHDNPSNYLSLHFTATGLEIVHAVRKGESGKSIDVRHAAVLDVMARREEEEWQLVAAVESFVRENGIPCREVILGLSFPDMYLLKYVTMPNLPASEIPNAAKWQLKDDVSFDIEQALVQCHVVDEFEDNGELNKHVLVLLADRSVIDRYIDIVQRAGLSVLGLVYPSATLASLLDEDDEPAAPVAEPVGKPPSAESRRDPRDAGVAVLDLGEDDAMLNIIVGKELYFVRELPSSLNSLRHSLTEGLISEQGRIELTLDQAGALIDAHGIPVNENALLEGGLKAKYIISLMRPLLEVLVREIRFSFDYFKATFGRPHPVRLRLAGNGALLKNLDFVLERELGLSVQSLIPADKNATVQMAVDPQRCVHALAAATAWPATMNLMPVEMRSLRVESFQKTTLRLAALTIGSIFLLSLGLTRLKISDYEKRVKNAQIHLQTVDLVRLLNEQVQVKEEFIRELRGQHVPAGEMIKMLSTLVPREIMLETLTLDQSSRQLTVEGRTLPGTASANSVLLTFMRRLEESPFFDEASLVSSRRESNGEVFDIQCDLAQEVSLNP